jgi:dTMP kinase
MVYQGYGRGLDFTAIQMVNNIAALNLNPDLVIFLDIPPEQGLARKRNLKDRFELEDLSFHQRVRAGYGKLAAADPDRWLIMDASLPKDEVAGIIWNRVSRLMA